MGKFASKRMAGFLCAAVCAVSLVTPALAAEAPAAVALDYGISTYMDNISLAQCVLTVKNGKVFARANVNGHLDADRCRIVLEIQKLQGNRWVTVESWTVKEDGRIAAADYSVSSQKGTTYRAKAKVTVWVDGTPETKTITTNGKKA